MKYETAFIKFFKKQELFDSNDARRFLSSMGAGEAYIRLMLHKMVQSGQLIRICKGEYTFHRNEAVVGFKFRPFYYGLQYALTIRKLWTQQSVPIIITESMANPGIRDLMDTRVILHRIKKDAFFGFEYISYSKLFIPVSDPEKTLLDFIYYGIQLDPETMNNLKKGIDETKFENYYERLFGKHYNLS
ncbi:MAG: hypothetical protein QXZ44_06680 [Ferroplasma sp.]